jgi:hypothetical protein
LIKPVFWRCVCLSLVGIIGIIVSIQPI